ncbi:hypothetical protein CTRG_03903 [Candida tropicalis MYA-3404]|uniref:DNA repair protein REV1 n=1 Tax=Candida tropicalis (strain ATCC MYA-3404 / T1) TaxID=294747 RepID=C5MCF2_CANTT|nr:hypothetical protein CTRG_03903 [Candida tropicalis MYA-3404]EER32232.1 hypothetical protein CTRG_03903 [Candida tropicalis MYA-3404]KAG4405832.1 hypothetical protein JTP64_004703 [Candida tropicalis]
MDNANSEDITNADVTETSQYQDFLMSLDDDKLISHVQNIGKQQELHHHHPSFHPSFQEVSTPRKNASFNSNISSDPFNDGLDDEIMNIGGSKTTEVRADIENESEENEAEKSVGELHKFGDYGTYFRSKHLKQQRQDEEYVKWDLKRRKLQNLDSEPKQIFQGCSIYVNGHTDPSINEIHRLVILHGGKFISYLVNKSSATHIVCDRLTPRKSIEYKNCRVVKAQWIVDSVAKQELLDWKEYRLIAEVAYNQKRLDFIKQNPIHEADEDQDEDGDGLLQEDDDDDDNNEFFRKSQELEQVISTTDKVENEDDDIELSVFEGEITEDQKGVHKVRNKLVLDARHPDFLPNFFKNSRLHHLSMWKSDLRLKFLRRIVKEELHQSQSKLDNPFLDSVKEKVIMHIDFDCFFATASCLLRPDLDINKHPIAVTHGGRTSDIASCNYVARSFGLKNGMWLGSAKKMCPNLITLPYDFDSYEKYSSEFYNYLLSSKYFDSIFPVSIDEVLVDATTYCNSQIGGIHTVVEELSSRIRQDVFTLTKCSVSVGASTNVLLAKLALRKAKPNGQFQLFDNVESFLQTISIRDLPGFGRGIMEKLQNHTSATNPEIKDILHLSKAALIESLGEKTGCKLYEYCRGIDETKIEIDTKNPEAMLGRKSVSVDVNFGIRFDTVEELDDFLVRLSKELYQRLVTLGICGSSLSLRLAKRAAGAPVNPPKFLGMGYCDYVNKSSRLGVPTNDWGIIGNEVKSLYRSVNIQVSELRGVSITMAKLKDTESVKNSRQMRLPFAKAKDKLQINDELKRIAKDASPGKPKTPERLFFKKNMSENKSSKISTSDPSFDIENFDWEVLDALPYDIKLELKGELRRRGLIPETSPTKGKVYRQQLLPTQAGSAPKYIRVVDSPPKKATTSPRKRKSSTPSPVKPKQKQKPQPMYQESQSYDSSVLNELPSSIKESVLKDMEYRKKIKKFDLAPMKDKLVRKIDETKVKVTEITDSWINQQEKLVDDPLFLNQRLSTRDLSKRIDDWVSSSLDQAGPHEEDMKLFAGFISELLHQNQLNRVLILIKQIKSKLVYQKSIMSLQELTEEDRLFKQEGIDDWNSQLDNQIEPLIVEYCKKRNITSIVY